MVLDESWSVGRNGFEKMKTLVGDIISLFSVNSDGAHFAAVKYGTYAREVFSLAKYTDAAELQRKVREMSYNGGGTYTGKALQLVQKRVYLFSFCFTYIFIPISPWTCSKKFIYLIFICTLCRCNQENIR